MKSEKTHSEDNLQVTFVALPQTVADLASGLKIVFLPAGFTANGSARRWWSVLREILKRALISKMKLDPSEGSIPETGRVTTLHLPYSP